VSPTKSPSGHKCAPAAATKTQPQKPQTPSQKQDKPDGNNNQSETSTDKPVGPPNKPAYQARLGLARVLVRKGTAMEEIQKLYEEVKINECLSLNPKMI